MIQFSPFELIEPDIFAWLAKSLAHILWQGALFAGLAAVLDQGFRNRSAQTSYLLHCSALFLVAACLPWNLWVFVPTDPTTVYPAPSGRTVEAESIVAGIPAANPHHGNTAMGWPAPPAEGPADSTTATTNMASEALSISESGWVFASRGIVATYLLGMIAMLLRLMTGIYGGYRLRIAATPVADSRVQAIRARITDQLRLQAAPMVAYSARVDTPLVVGVIKPMILLPVAILNNLTIGQVELLILHELAHIRRYDHVVNLLQRMIEALLFFHPAVWWLSHQISKEREYCCDDLAIAWGSAPCDYAESLVRVSEFRYRAAGLGASSTATLATTGGRPTRLRSRVLRVLGIPLPGPNPGLSRVGMVVLLTLVVSLAAFVATRAGGDNSEPETSEDFDLENPPPAYERGIRIANRNHAIEAGDLQFQLSAITRQPDGSLEAALGCKSDYEVVAFRLFDHQTRHLIHDSAWQLNMENDPATRLFHALRVGASERIRIEETAGTLPGSLDLWLRIVENGPGERILIPARVEASGKLRESEIVITSLLPGIMSGKSDRAGRMIWDRSSAQDTTWRATVDFENRGESLQGRYHVVAVTKEGWRHPMDHTHFIEFSRGFGPYSRHTYVQLDVAPDRIDHFELIPFKTRHKFFFNGITVPQSAEQAHQPAGTSVEAEAISAKGHPDNPLGLDNETLIRLYNTGKTLRVAAHECVAYQVKYSKIPEQAESLFEDYQQFRQSMIRDPFAAAGGVLRLTQRTDGPDNNWLQVWSVGPDGDWDGGQPIDSTDASLNGDLGAEMHMGKWRFHWLTDDTIARYLDGKRLSHYLAAQAPKYPGAINPHQGFDWGPVVDGLCMAVQLVPQEETYVLGKKIGLEFHIRNVSPYPITIAGFSWRQDAGPDSIVIQNEKGEKLQVAHAWYSGDTPIQRNRLKPGEIAVFQSSPLAFLAPGMPRPEHPVGHTVLTGPGRYRLQCNLLFPDGSSSFPDGMPRPTDWQGTLQTATKEIVLVNPDNPETSENSESSETEARARFLAIERFAAWLLEQRSGD